MGGGGECPPCQGQPALCQPRCIIRSGGPALHCPSSSESPEAWPGSARGARCPVLLGTRPQLHLCAEHQPRHWDRGPREPGPALAGPGVRWADSDKQQLCYGARLLHGFALRTCPPTEALPWASCTRDPLLGLPGSGEVSGPELGVREASARAGPPVPLPRLSRGVVFQQGSASELFVDAVARTADELEAANLPPSKRRKADATWVEVADVLSADPEQVVCTHSGTRRLPRALHLHAIQHPDREAPSDACPARGWSKAEPCPQDSALVTEDALLTLNFGFYRVRPTPPPPHRPPIFRPSLYFF